MNKVKIRFISPCAEISFFDPVKKGMNAAAKMVGADVSFVGSEDIDLPVLKRCFRQALKDGCDGIAISLPDENFFKEDIKEAQNKGIPVIVFNMDASYGRAGQLSSVTQDLYKAGFTLGIKVAPHMKVGSKVLVTQHSTNIFALDTRLKGIQDALKDKKLNWRKVITGNGADNSYKSVDEEINKDKSRRIILCTGHDDTEGAGMSVSKLKDKRNYIVAGFDLSERILHYIKENVILFTIDQQPYMQGFMPVIQIFLYRRYKIMPSNIDAGAAVITKDDVDRILALIKKGYR